MKRREFIWLAGTAAAWPVAAWAQQPARLLRIGTLVNYAEADPVGKSFVTGFVRRLATLGWVENQNLIIDLRWSGGDVNRLSAYARELVFLQPAAILSHTTPATIALKQETQNIPIVFVAISDPVDTGLVESLAHPGGNITGFVNIEAALAGKWLELLKEVTPRLSRVPMMFNPETAPFARHYLAPLEKLGSASNIIVVSAPVRSEAEIEKAITELGREPGGGMILINDIYSFVHRKLINSLTITNKIPAVFFKDGGQLAVLWREQRVIRSRSSREVGSIQ
ncbi:MAG: hypothetical protein QOH32_4475 [Bradyrhizobium sp.]|jgi:putative ABC transport system substrate-binding protein|nr:hypothetical protein [Bradyrhizobium sp.]